jgi:tRNA pseudouridine32 synthase/23S rRNA pseudouridine746 synthase
LAEDDGPPPPLVYAPPAEPRLTVIHADARLLILSKPSGLLTVPGKGPDLADCLEARARAAYPGALTVHRLDLQTSGLVVMARDPLAQRILSGQFAKRLVRKTYVARVAGRPPESGRIDAPLAADWPNRPRQRIDRDRGRAAVTDWTTIGVEPGATRLRLAPITGRSHQLRVHLASLGHPILGDPLYGTAETRAAAERLQLHAESLAFRHPADGRAVAFADPCPF